MANPFGTPLSEEPPFEVEEPEVEVHPEEELEEQVEYEYEFEVGIPARFWEVLGSPRIKVYAIKGPEALLAVIEHFHQLWAHLDAQHTEELKAKPSRVSAPAISSDPSAGTPATRKHKDFVMDLLEERALTPADFGFDIKTVSKEFLNSIIDSEIKPKAVVKKKQWGGGGSRPQTQRRAPSGGGGVSQGQLNYIKQLEGFLEAANEYVEAAVPTSSTEADAMIKALKARVTDANAWPERK